MEGFKFTHEVTQESETEGSEDFIQYALINEAEARFILSVIDDGFFGLSCDSGWNTDHLRLSDTEEGRLFRKLVSAFPAINYEHTMALLARWTWGVTVEADPQVIEWRARHVRDSEYKNRPMHSRRPEVDAIALEYDRQIRIFHGKIILLKHIVYKELTGVEY